MVRGARRGPRRDQADRRLQKELRAQVGKPKRTRRQEGARPGAARRDRGRHGCEPLLEAMRIPGKLRLATRKMKEVEDAYLASIPEDQPAKRAAVPAVYDGLREKLLAHRDPDARPAPRRPPLRRDPADHLRGGRAAAHPRLGALHARRDAGARHGHARHQRGRADHRHGAGAGVQEALHAALQLPALLGRRGEVPARPRPARDRPRRARRAGAARDAARRRTPSPTRSASSPTSSSRTARPRWPRSAAARSR